ncbi:hypothetical protein Gotur_035417 [Gossypium turneri]
MEKRNKAPAEEQRTNTSRGRNNQQRNKEPAPAEEQRTSTKAKTLLLRLGIDIVQRNHLNNVVRRSSSFKKVCF